MQIKRLSNQATDALLILLREEDTENFSNTFSGLFDDKLRDFVMSLISRKDFTGKKGSLVKLPLFDSQYKNLYLIGLGKKDKCDTNLIRDSLTWGFRKIGRERNKSVSVILKNLQNYKELVMSLGEAAGLCEYTFDKYKTKDKDYEPFALEEIYTGVYEGEENKNEISKGMKLAEAQIFSREIINEPGCVILQISQRKLRT